MLGLGASRVCIDGAGKFAVAEFPVPQFNFVRSIIAIAVMAPFVLRGTGGLAALRTAQPWMHVLRAGLQMLIVSIWYLSLSHLELADATAITMGAPVVITVLSALILKEYVGPRRWAAVVVGFLGMLLIIRPGTSLFDPWALLPFGVSFAYAGFWITSRALRTRESVAALVFYPQLGVMLISGIWVAFVWVPLNQSGLIAMVIGGVGGAIAHLTMTLAARWAPVSVLAPLDYVPLIWAIIVGYFMFGDLPDIYTVAGAVLIISAGLFIAYREAKLEKADRAQRPIDAA